MPPSRLRRSPFSYRQTIEKSANLRRAMTLVSPLLECNGDLAMAARAGRDICDGISGPPVDGGAVNGGAGDWTPWSWLRDVALDGHALGEYQTTARIGVAADVWQWMVDQDDRLATVSGLGHPSKDIVATLFALGLDSVSRLGSRFPLAVTTRAVYPIEDVARRFAAGLLTLHSQGYPIDPATYQFAQGIRGDRTD